MEREIRFIQGYDCMKFHCKFDSKRCIPNEGGSHGIHGLEIAFYVKGDKGVVQFKLSTGWTPQKSKKNSIGVIDLKEYNLGNLYPMPTDLGYHSYKPHYKGHKSIIDSCELLGGKKCYYDGSGLNSHDAFYTLVNGGYKALWKFLEGYYKRVFEKGKYPKVFEYPKQERVLT